MDCAASVGADKCGLLLLEENAPTADVRDLIGPGGAKEVTGSSSGDDVQAKKTDDDTAGLVDLRNSYSQEPRSSYFP